MKIIQGVIFDLFGTIFFEERKVMRYREFAQAIGRNIDDYEFLKAFEQHFMTSLFSDFSEKTEDFLKAMGVPRDEAKVAHLIKILNDFSTESFKMFDDAKAALRTLKSKYKLGLYTNSAAPVFQKLRERFKIYDIFDGITTSFELCSLKPTKEMLLSALHSLGLNRDQVMFVGDSFKDDFRALENIGLNAVLLDRHDKYPQCERRIRSIPEITKFLK